MADELFCTGRDGRLHARLWTATSDACVGTMVVVHGLGDHSGRYQPMARLLAEEGWSVLAFDLPGHGRSPGTSGKIESFNTVLEDIGAARQELQRRFPDVPQVLLGHSMGGNFALNYSLRKSNIDASGPPLAGLCLCAPMLLPPRPMPRPFIFAAWLTGYLLPWYRFTRKLDADALTSDTHEAAVINDDPEMHSDISMYLATQLVSQGRWALDHAPHVGVPTLVMYGEQDELIDRSACEHLSIRIGQSATLVKWPETKHAMFHDIEREFVIQRIKRWLGTLRA